MPNHDLAMLAFATLADISRQRGQQSGCDRFLLLAGQAACHAGWLDVAERCRLIVLAHNPHHLLGRYESFPDALRAEDFQPYLRNLERFCSYEHAEHLLQGLGLDSITLAADGNYGEKSLALLSQEAAPAW